VAGGRNWDLYGETTSNVFALQTNSGVHDRCKGARRSIKAYVLDVWRRNQEEMGLRCDWWLVEQDLCLCKTLLPHFWTSIMPPKSKSIFRQPGVQHFQLVHRSQRDPLINDPNASAHVLKPFERDNVKKVCTHTFSLHSLANEPT